MKYLVAVLALFLVVTLTEGRKLSETPFGLATPYSVFSFEGLHIESSTVKGRVAAGELLEVSSSSIGRDIDEASELFTAVSGDELTWNSGTCWYGGITANSVDVTAVSIIINADTVIQSECCADVNCFYCNDEATSQYPVDWARSWDDLATLSTYWSELNTNEENIVMDAAGTLYLRCGNRDNFVVFDEVDPTGMSEIDISCDNLQTILINYVAGVTTLPEISLHGIRADTVIHHFTGATSLNFQNENVYGTIFAPWSDVWINDVNVWGYVIGQSVYLADDATIYNTGFNGQAYVNSRPNILFFLTDDLGYGDLSSNGHPTIRTPNIDALAYGGLKLTNYYVEPMCSPTRASLLTGRFPIRTGVYNGNLDPTANPFGTPPPVFYPVSYGMLPVYEVLLPEIIKPQGYRSALFGKWHLGSRNISALPVTRGFDHFWGMPYSSDMGCPPAIGYECHNTAGNADIWVPIPLYHDNEIIEQPTTFEDFMPRMMNEVKDFITDSVALNKPFYISCNWVTPHLPLFTAPPFAGVSPRGIYGDTIEEIDWWVGEIVKFTEDLQIADNTLIVFTSDNGPSTAYRIYGGIAGPFRGGKGQTWEGGIRAPSYWYWPGEIKPNTFSHQITNAVDTFTTFIKLAGAEVPQDREIDGLDLRGVIFNDETLDRQCFPIYSQKILTAVRCGDYKLHYYVKDTIYGIPYEVAVPILYNVNVDTAENYPLDYSTNPVFQPIVNRINNYKNWWLSVLVPGPSQFEYYDYTGRDVEQPCCDTWPTDCYCPRPGFPDLRDVSAAEISERQHQEYTTTMNEMGLSDYFPM